MLSKNKLKIMLSFLRELENGNIPKYSDYNISESEFYDIVDACQDEGYIKNARIARDGQKRILKIFLEETKLTISGMEYLKDNTAVMVAYKGLKELREWLA